MDGQGAGGSTQDLIVIALPGVRRFISEARSTSDVAAASEIYVALAKRAITALREAGAELVLPAPGAAGEAPRGDQGFEPGMPNRVVALWPASGGSASAKQKAEVAKQAAASGRRAAEVAAAGAAGAVRDAWRDMVRQAFRTADDAPVQETHGFPCVQWVCGAA